MSKLFYKDKPFIGLDISQTGIKVMSIDPKRWLVIGYGSLDLDPAKVQVSLDNPEDTYLTESLTSLLQKNIVGTLRSDHVIVGLPTGKTFSRTFTVPVAEEKHIDNAVEIEVDQYIPIPLGSLYVDHEIIERTKEELTVIMSAVPQTLVDTCLQAVRSAANTDIAVLDKGAIRITSSVGIGGNTFTIDIAKKLNISLENAHQYKVLNGLNSGPRQAKISAAMRPSLERIVTEIRKVIRYYNERLVDNRKIEQILIVGGGANVPGIGEFFTNELVMPARVASPWQKLDFGNLPEPNKQFRPRYITVAGLACVTPEEVWK